MAVGAEEAQAIVTSKQLLKDNGLALYMGTLALGSEYAAGGDTLATDPNSRYSLPEKLDFMLIGPRSRRTSPQRRRKNRRRRSQPKKTSKPWPRRSSWPSAWRRWTRSSARSS
jgi:hypothetical protein